MPKDYKNRIPAYRQRKQQRARQFGLVAAAAAGLAALAGTGVYFLTRSEVEAPAPAAEAAAEAPAAETKGKPVKGKAPEPAKPLPAIQQPRFTFYKILPEKEVLISESQVKALKREESQGKATGTGYLVQAGSFSSQQEAEKLKAQLAALNVQPKMEMIKLDDAVWYRVKLGPYRTLADADKVRQHLRNNKIDSKVQQSKVIR